MNKYLYLSLLALLHSPHGMAQKASFIDLVDTAIPWVDSVCNSMSEDEKIGQLFMVHAYSNRGKYFEDSIAQVIQEEHIGGLVLFQGGPVRQAALVNRYQRISKIPLLLAMDGEWGVGMRLDSCFSYPFAMTLGAIARDRHALIEQMGVQIAKDFKRLGMHLNFAPVMDINNHPKNLVIGYRSFGDNKHNVTEKGIAFIKGLQAGGLLCTAKHFPGHGATDVDSHKDLPLLSLNKKRLESLEMYPFKKAVKAGLSGMMIGHISVPGLDPAAHLPATLSRLIVTDLLKKKLGFKGLVVSDALYMQGVVKYFSNNEADVRALIAGNDILELSTNTKHAIKMVRKAVHQHRITKIELDAKVKKILTAKYWAGLNNWQAIATENIVADLNRQEAIDLQQQLCDAAVTLLKNEGLPIKSDVSKRTAIIALGAPSPTVFQSTLLGLIPNAQAFVLKKDADTRAIERLKNVLGSYDRLILAIYDNRDRALSSLDYSPSLKEFIGYASTMEPISVVFANPYTLSEFPAIEKSKSLLICYQSLAPLEHAAVKVLIGIVQARGRLPVSVHPFFRSGAGK